MSWKHEEPLEKAICSPAIVPADLVAKDNHESGEALHILGSSSLPESSLGRVSEALNSSYPGPLADINSAGSENGDTGRPFFPSNSSPPCSGKRGIVRREP